MMCVAIKFALTSTHSGMSARFVLASPIADFKILNEMFLRLSMKSPSVDKARSQSYRLAPLLDQLKLELSFHAYR